MAAPCQIEDSAIYIHGLHAILLNYDWLTETPYTKINSEVIRIYIHGLHAILLNYDWLAETPYTKMNSGRLPYTTIMTTFSSTMLLWGWGKVNYEPNKW